MNGDNESGLTAPVVGPRAAPGVPRVLTGCGPIRGRATRGFVMNPKAGGAVFTVAALVVALLAAPAYAERYRETDPAGDMVAWDDGVVSPAPERRNLDLRRVKVRHREHRVVIRAAMRALRVPKTRSQTFGLAGFIKVNPEAQPSESVAWRWEVVFNQGRPRHGTRLFILDALHEEQFGCDWLTHPGLKGRANYRDDVVTVTIPRHCLALDDEEDVRPRWVRVSVSTRSTSLSRVGYYDHMGPDAGAWPELGAAHFTPRLFSGSPG
jgi:hypothetical protein